MANTNDKTPQLVEELHAEQKSCQKEIVPGEEVNTKVSKEEMKEEVAFEIEPKSGTSFSSKMDDGKKLNCVGLRMKSIHGFNLKIYSFGIYVDNERLRELLKSTFKNSLASPTKEMYQVVIDSDVEMTARWVIVFVGLTMTMVSDNINESLGAAIKKLNGGNSNKELIKKVKNEIAYDTKLPPGSIIEISRLPGYTLQIKVKGKVISKIESKLLCRAFIFLYLGDDAFDKDAKEKFGMSMLTLF